MSSLWFDEVQAEEFYNALLGWKTLGVDASGDEISVPICPEMRAYVTAVLGDVTPNSWRHLTGNAQVAGATVSLIRGFADAIERHVNDKVLKQIKDAFTRLDRRHRSTMTDVEIAKHLELGRTLRDVYGMTYVTYPDKPGEFVAIKEKD